MSKQIKRKDFLKLSVLANLGLVTGSLQSMTAPFMKAPTGQSGPNVDYYKKGDEQYELLRKGFNRRIDKFPLVIALCKNTQGVAEAVAYASAYNLPVAIKSGGHCMEGFSCNDGGMVINLSLLNTVEWVNNDLIKVGPGCKLAELYAALLPKKKIIPGGSCAGVGIGGLSLGGGYGLLSRNYGLTCDSLEEVTMVDGKGVIRNSKDDPELLWACKGGGNGNFGIITEMKFRLHKAPATMESWRFKTFKATAAKAESIFRKWFELSKTLPITCFSACLLNGKTVYILLTNTGSSNEAVDGFIKNMSAISEKTTHSKSQAIDKALKVYYGQKEPVRFKNASAGLYKDYSEIEKYISSVLEIIVSNPGMIYQVNTLGGNIQKPEFAANSSFPHRDCFYFSELQTYWENDRQGKRLMERFQAVQEIFIKNGIGPQYRNYPDINFQQWDTKYYGSNYGRLQEIKNKYDPLNIIRHEQSIKNK